jgi:hypothetical protein
MTDHRDGSACVGAVVRKPPGKESAEDDVVTMTRIGDLIVRCSLSAWSIHPGRVALEAKLCDVWIWHLAIFGCTAEIGRNRANADLAPSSAANDL